jgi:tetratricopeptide (TPR) repeat protein
LGNDIDMAIEGEITDELDVKASTDVTDDDEISLELEDSSYELEDNSSSSEISLEKELEIISDEVKVKKSGISDGFLSDVFNRNEIIINKSDTKPPFDEANDSNIFEGLDEEELFEGEPIIFESDDYYELEEKAKAEIESIVFWMKELERQRTSTIEKNMMEIFEEFKKGVEDKIGQEDYDTRYNLGIAYKEMGLLEEAIHEFLIASKHPLKLFDSAGLLGICFREKGMHSEGITWLKKALGLPGRQDDEYLNIKYELISCYDLSEDMESAKELANEIMGINPDFRDIREIHSKLMRE